MEMGNGRLFVDARSVFKFACVVTILFAIFSSSHASAGPYKKVEIKWNVYQWKADGYVAMVEVFNLQAPDWSLGWKWAKKEVIWSVVGAKSTDQGDCSRFRGQIPNSCRRDPTLVALTSKKLNHAVSFQIYVGNSGNTNSTVKIPSNFNLMSPGFKYTCGAPKIVKPSMESTPDGEIPQAYITWSVEFASYKRQKTASTA